MVIENSKIKLESGEEVNAQCPVIISASRRTDIPAFYSEWFINRIKEGYVAWVNPYSKEKQYISFEKCKVIVFWTKNPKPLIPYLDELDKRGIHYYFQYTLNDYDKENLEPNVPPIEERINTFIELSNIIGPDRIIWRFDPIILSGENSVRSILIKIWNLGNKLKGYTNKLVFSFVDINGYKKVKENLPDSKELTESQMNEIADGLSKCKNKWMENGWDLKIATCGEKIDFEKYNIEHNRCIDSELIEKLWENDSDLIHYIKFGEFPGITNYEKDKKPLTLCQLKDKGQRKECGCMISKDIGMYNTCKHFCKYCYANSSKESVIENIKNHNNKSEII